MPDPVLLRQRQEGLPQVQGESGLEPSNRMWIKSQAEPVKLNLPKATPWQLVGGPAVGGPTAESQSETLPSPET